MPDIVVAFFALGLIAGLVKSDLKVPGQIYEILTILLMLSIGIKGGLALHSNGDSIVWSNLFLIMALGFLSPPILFPVLRKLVRLPRVDAISIAAHYGSVSAGTFAVAWALAESYQLPLAADTTLYLVILELPAIVLMLAFYHWRAQKDVANTSGAEGEQTTAASNPPASMGAIWHEALTSRGVILLMGGVVIGWLYGPSGLASIEGLVLNGFSALLALFLLEMGITTARICRPFPFKLWRLVLFAALAPLVMLWPGLLLGFYLELPTGSVLVLSALTASASYIAAPAAIRAAIPSADIGKAMLAALGITFPLNVLVYIPVLAVLLG
ncbi:sodium-dependent bicarbonate transport family permease [Aliidiomarina shirensis]|uniref:Sodium-dependent bicarbonate transport family permease n=1 Tax=Aliidiomarina shirensis TaxID=1048642 RepID=A0A432WWI1_9GAMM|nr:sodium-dependent bicarbonate transport family permease [Aliidiomarina shirensis]RUO38140.1 sodium-dependent bicarbonate transport family permease [Aliidiomarina shirensis]